MTGYIKRQALLDWLETLPHHSGKANIMNEICTKRFDSTPDDSITELAINALERIAVTFEREEMVRIAYATLEEIKKRGG